MSKWGRLRSSVAKIYVDEPAAPELTPTPKALHHDPKVRLGKWFALVKDFTMYPDLVEHASYGIVTRDLAISVCVVVILLVMTSMKASALWGAVLPVVVHTKDEIPALGRPTLKEYEHILGQVESTQHYKEFQFTCQNPQVYTKVTL